MSLVYILSNMKLNVLQKVNSTQLKTSELLLPFFETVVNAIQAIHLRQSIKERGQIIISIKRVQIAQLKTDNSIVIPPITSFIVEDNGIGFDKTNFESFNTAHSANKIRYGCKGVGRFLVLKAFDNMKIESTYSDGKNNGFHKRNILFDVENEITSDEPKVVNEEEYKTIVYLNDYKLEYKQKVVETEDVATQLLEHCLVYYITGNAPDIILHDEFLDNPIDLKSVFEKKMQYDGLMDEFSIEQSRFNIYYIKQYTPKGEHKIHYCANSREVTKTKISKILPGLSAKIEDEKRGKYLLSIYVTGKYLDNHVNLERNKLTIPSKKEDKDLTDALSMEELNHEIIDKIKTTFSIEIKKVMDAAKRAYEDYIYTDEGVEYRYLLPHLGDLIQELPADVSNNQKEEALHKLDSKYSLTHKKNVNHILKKAITSEKDIQEYREELYNIVEEGNGLAKSRLAKYMIQRKYTLLLLEKNLEITDELKYKPEADIHNLFYPKKTDSTSINFNEHNLWILDERLAYHQYISSDKPFKDVKVVDSDSDKAADLFFYENRMVYGENGNQDSIVIFEFKKPMRKNYKVEEKDLGAQIVKYVLTLLKGNAVNYKGRPVSIDKNTPKFGYVICDYDRNLADHFELNSYDRTPKGTYFKYEKGTNLFIEIMSYDQLLKDAKLRHQAFFNKLGIDSF